MEIEMENDTPTREYVDLCVHANTYAHTYIGIYIA